MSLKALSEVSEWENVSTQIIAVGFHLANCANGKTGLSFPSLEYLAKKTSLTCRSIRRILSDMESRELIRREYQYGQSGIQKTTNYVFLHKKQEETIGGHQCQGEGDTHNPHREDASVPHKQEVTRNINQEIKPLSSKHDERVKVAIDYLNLKTGHRFQSGKENTKILTSLLTEYKIEDLMAVIDSKTAEWMNTEHQKYLRPSTLFRRSKFIEYLGMAHISQPDTRTGAQILMDNIGQNYERTDSTENNRQPLARDHRNLGQQVFPTSTGSTAYHSAALDEDTSPFHS